MDVKQGRVTAATRQSGDSRVQREPITLFRLWVVQVIFSGLASALVALAMVVESESLEVFQVAGPSMSPTLWGPSYVVQCPECRWQYRIHRLPHEELENTLCFHCGERVNLLVLQELPGQLVALDRTAYQKTAPQRNDLVAVRKSSGEIEVKRIVGVPGDLMQIDRQGQIKIDGSIFPSRDSLSQWQEAWERAIVVFDHPSKLSMASRWRMDGEWFVYEHRNVYNNNLPGAIGDDDPANFGERRALLPANSLWLSLQFAANGPGVLEVCFWTDEGIYCGRSAYQVGQQSQRWACWENRVWCWEGNVEDPGTRIDLRGLHLTRQRPVALRFTSATKVEPMRLWLGTDRRYDPPYAVAPQWQRGIVIPSERYIVLGDNPARSADSRTIPTDGTLPGIGREQILGRVEIRP